MTNLIEKILLTGFGIFVLMSFFFIIAPLTNLFNEYDDYKDDVNETLININEIDNCVQYISIYHNSSISKELEISNNLNISIEESKIEYFFKINQEVKKITCTHNIILNNKKFNLIHNMWYNLSISYKSYSIDINFTLLE
ncbi:MAG: hypothetical protein JXA99_15010 [Candidatus Lokiarchaeota archaeon]|nr:hypothetical protein [Candidatus Lokiarchaeota archaeon]